MLMLELGRYPTHDNDSNEDGRVTRKGKRASLQMWHMKYKYCIEWVLRQFTTQCVSAK